MQTDMSLMLCILQLKCLSTGKKEIHYSDDEGAQQNHQQVSSWFLQSMADCISCRRDNKHLLQWSTRSDEWQKVILEGWSFSFFLTRMSCLVCNSREESEVSFKKGKQCLNYPTGFKSSQVSFEPLIYLKVDKWAPK